MLYRMKILQLLSGLAGGANARGAGITMTASGIIPEILIFVNAALATSTAMMKNAAMLKWLWLSFAVVVADQMSKLAASAYLAMHEPLAVGPYVNLFLTHNTGAAFSLLASAGGWQRWIFILIAALVVWFLVAWLDKLSEKQKSSAFAIALVVGGAVGNLVDRLVFAYVIDFIDVHYEDRHWPTFNLADSAITVGAMLLIWVAVSYRES